MSSFTKLIFLILISFLTSNLISAQQLSVSTTHDINMPSQDLMFGNDVMIVNNEPEGPIGGVKANDGTIWVVINDTTIVAGSGLLFYKSTNAGVNWTQHGTSIQPAFIANQVKMIKAGDSIYCFFRLGGAVYRFNVGNSSLAQFAPANNIEHFDVTSSSTNSLYIFYSNPTNLMRYGSIDGGFTWGNSGNVSTGSKKPAIFMSATSDSLTLLYRAAGGDSSAITRFGYKETSPGVLSSNTPVGAILTAGIKRIDYYPYRIGSSVWVVYDEESATGVNLKCLTSTNRGNNFSAPIDISANAGNDNFWFTGGISPNGSFLGLDLFWLRDSTGTANDKLMYVGCEYTNPIGFGIPVAISQNPPVFSNRGYKPCAIELGSADVGVVFVAENSGTRRVYWDRYDAVTNITNNNGIADNYSLSQNFPNPFNPSTKISFSIPQSDHVTLKVYDMMGKEVATLVNNQMNMGSYSLDFNAANLSSGVYFYKLISGNFTEVKKMTLLK